MHFPLFDRIADEDLDEQRLQRFFFAQDAPEALEVFALTRPTPQHDRHLRFRHIDALIEHPGRDDHTVVPLLESVENVLAFSDPCFMGDDWHQVLARNGVGDGVGLGEHEDAVTRVLTQ